MMRSDRDMFHWECLTEFFEFTEHELTSIIWDNAVYDLKPGEKLVEEAD